MSKQDSENTASPMKLRNYTIKIGENLYKRIDKLMHLLKYTNSACNNRQKWLIDAFIKKLETEELLGLEGIPKEKYLRFLINEELKEKIDRRVELLNQYKSSFSKKQWFLEAIFEQLDNDEQKMQKLLKEKSQIYETPP